MARPLTVLLCAPRGFCAGVVRAIAMVEAALRKHGAPVYVRHEIVHNRYVVEDLRAKGAIFVKELEDIPVTTQPVLFSAHGVSRAVVEAAAGRGFNVLDATCPLVSKVHHEAGVLHRQGHHIMMIGHVGHPEVLGTLGQIPEGAGTLVQTPAEAETVQLPDVPLALVTQTTLSVDETRETIAVLVRRFPDLKLPKKEDICYATTNRQAAVKLVAPRVDLMLVVGAPHSSNSQRLREAALLAGAKDAVLIERADALEGLAWEGIGTVGITAAASAPEVLVDEVLAWLRGRFEVRTEDVEGMVEDVVFKVPQELGEWV